MKLNPDCIRDILLLLEKETDGIKYISYKFDVINLKTDCPLIAKYSVKELYYHFGQCEANGFFMDIIRTTDVTISVLALSPKAHDFLENIRDNSVWNKTKAVIKQVGSSSLDVAISIAAETVKKKLSELLIG